MIKESKIGDLNFSLNQNVAEQISRLLTPNLDPKLCLDGNFSR